MTQKKDGSVGFGSFTVSGRPVSERVFHRPISLSLSQVHGGGEVAAPSVHPHPVRVGTAKLHRDATGAGGGEDRDGPRAASI